MDSSGCKMSTPGTRVTNLELLLCLLCLGWGTCTSGLELESHLP
jgi:hypothetical protein